MSIAMTAMPKDARLLREAFRRRAEAVLDRMANGMPTEVLAKALAAPSDVSTLAHALAEEAASEATRRFDPFAAARARAVEARAELAGKAGGLLSASETAARLGITRQAVNKRRAAGRLLAVRMGGDWRYPAIQFNRDGGVVAGLDEVIARMGRDDSPWGILSFLVSEDTALGGRTPLETLRAGDIALIDRLLAQRETDVYG
jgi:hypothetical protein